MAVSQRMAVSAVALACAISPAGAALAQQASTAQLDEVVVTAQKRTARLSDVPVSVNVLDNQAIERRGVVALQEYLRSVPGVSQMERGGIDSAIVIRGVTTSPQSENFAAGATVASYFGETTITGAAGLSGGNIDIRPVDLERVEVLRGPQGTTFGSSSLGGAVRLIPAAPTFDKVSGRIAGSYGRTGRYGGDDTSLQGALNVPVTDNWALRVAAYRFDDSGFYKNVPNGEPGLVTAANNAGLGALVRVPAQDNIGRTVTTGARVISLWKPTEAFDLSLTYLTQKIEQDGRPEATFGKYLQARTPVDQRVQMRGRAGEVQDAHLNLANATANYNFGWATLTATGSWVESGIDDVNITLPPSSSALSTFLTISRNRAWSGEMRLASKADQKLRYLVGTYYEDVKSSLYQPFGFWPGTQATNRFGTDPYSVFDYKRPYQQRAAFGEVAYDLLDNLTLTVGARAFKYDKTDSTFQEGGLLAIPYGTTVPTVRQTKESGKKFKAAVAYKPTKNSLVYANFSQGFRLGRPDVGAIPSLCDLNRDGNVDGTGTAISSTTSLNSDNLDSYEVGAKAPLGKGRGFVNVSAYRLNWDGLPFRIVPFVNCAYVANAGKATSQGIDLQLAYRLTEGLTVEAGFGYSDPKLSENALGVSPAAIKGARLPGSPKVNATLSLEQRFDLVERPAYIRMDAMYAGAYYGDFPQSALTKAGDYVKVDLKAGMTFNDLTVDVYVRNLTNEDAFTWRNNSPAGLLPFQGYLMRPRSAGVQLGYRF